MYGNQKEPASSLLHNPLVSFLLDSSVCLLKAEKNLAIMSALSRFWSHTHPYFITGGVMSLGDYVSQTMVEKKEQVDVARNIRFGALGLFFVSPVLHNWFKYLDKRIVGNTGIAPLKKVIVDQSLMAPSINTAILIILEAAQRTPWEDIKGKCKNNLPDILVNQYKLWPAVQLFNFYMVPVQYRVFTVVFVAFFWNIYLAQALQGSAAPSSAESSSSEPKVKEL